jgi:oxaloacetate decarboxylase alpha subunit
VFNVLFGKYNRLSCEFQDLLVGKYGACPAPKNPDVVKKALEALKMEKEITHRPADDIPNEYEKLEAETKKLLETDTVSVEDVLTYAMFPKVAPDFFKKRSQGPVVFKPEPDVPKSAAPAANQAARYSVNVNGTSYDVVVAPAGTVAVTPAASSAPAVSGPVMTGSTTVPAPVAGTILKYAVAEGADIAAGDTIVIIESMKMELEIKSTVAGKVHFLVPAGTQVAAQQPVAEIGGVAVSAAPAAPLPPPAAAPAPASAAPGGAGMVIPAPVAGTVLKYAVNEGSRVASGDTIVIIESMKMELEIKSTVAGKVHFLVPAGTQVASQQALAEIG